MTFIKFCGMTRGEDVRVACELGVDALGFVMWPRSPRYVTPVQVSALVQQIPAAITAVGVLVSPSDDEIAAARHAGVQVVQVHAAVPAETRSDTWVAATLDGGIDAIAAETMIVLDAHDPVRHGGTGRTIDWERAAAVAAHRRVLLAGGLTPTNVATAVRRVKPFGVDVASGIEDRPGIKNVQAMAAFVAAVREADR